MELTFGSYIFIGILIAYLGRRYIFALFRGLEEMGRGERKKREPAGAERAPDELLPHEEVRQAIEGMDERRRNVLKLFGLGAGALVVGKIIGPSLNFLPGDVEDDIMYFQNFRVVEHGKNLGFFDTQGNEVLTLEGELGQPQG